TFVATAWLFGVILNIMKLFLYLSLKIINPESLAMDLGLLPFLVLGALSGIVLNKRLSPNWFNRLVLILVLGIGLKLMVS
ncbi:MAG: sulfite exporter TauE/SafE family protein, partial [bacterium]|nr:sulfite exporter TauE/SafE family protein [bacterium]